MWTTLNQDVWLSWLRIWPHWTMTSYYCDYGVVHHGSWRLMAVIRQWTTLDHDARWSWLYRGPPWTMMSDGCNYGVDHIVPWRLMTVIMEWTTLDNDVWWLRSRGWSTLDHDVWGLWLRSEPHWAMTSGDCNYGVDHLGPWCLMTVITQWTPLDHDVWWP